MIIAWADFSSTITDLLSSKHAAQDAVVFRLVLAALVALVIAGVINWVIGLMLPYLARVMLNLSNKTVRGDTLMQMRRTETFLSVGAAVGRSVVVGVCLYLAWRLSNPTSAPLAIIGASTFFIVLGAATIGPLLRDLTNGILMIAEKWYNVGDHIVVDPFINMGGVVEQVNLRSTKLRSLNGEIIWVHNQHIQGVRVAPRGLRTISLDTFVSDLERGRNLIERVLETMPTGPAMIAGPLTIIEEEQLGGLWRITAVGQTSPGREWLIEDFAVKALLKLDSSAKPEPVIVYGPIVRFTDDAAEKRFLRSMGPKSRIKAKPKSKSKPTA